MFIIMTLVTRRMPVKEVIDSLTTNFDINLYHRFGTVSFLPRRIEVLKALSPNPEGIMAIGQRLKHPYYEPDVRSDLKHFVDLGYVTESDGARSNGSGETVALFSLTSKGIAALEAISEINLASNHSLRLNLRPQSH